MKQIVFLLFFFGVQAIIAQEVISGYVNLENPEDWKPRIYLSQIAISETENNTLITPVAIADVDTDGFFNFNKKYFSESDKIYRLHVERMRKVINDTIQKDVAFLLSNKDKLVFKRGQQVFASYTSTNQGDQEWQKLKEFESKLVKQYELSEEMTSPRKAFVKDSLRILMVKLIGIKQLEEKQLLEKDIAENPEYYLALLDELKESAIKPSEYWFLEKRMAYLTQEAVEKQLQTSRWLNAILIVFLGMAIFGIFYLRKKPVTSSPLSRQEENIKILILQGKSNKEIANELFISLSTVKTHITHIYNKLNVSNRRELLQKSTGTST